MTYDRTSSKAQKKTGKRKIRQMHCVKMLQTFIQGAEKSEPLSAQKSRQTRKKESLPINLYGTQAYCEVVAE
jgi:hypothetical protein